MARTRRHLGASVAAGALFAIACGRDGDGGDSGGRAPCAAARPRDTTVTAAHARPLLAAGAGHTCAIAADQRVFCWGSNPDGQLGDGTQIDRSRPAAVLNVARAVAVSAGSYHACALIADGTVRCWGWNVAGQVGDNTRTNRLEAVAVTGIAGAAAIATGSYHSCALIADGQARCWGQNDSGQLGDGSTLDRATAIDVFSLPPSTALTASGRHTCALTRDGQVQCWGGNELGELGDGTTTPHPFPAPVSVLAGTIVAVRAGFNHTCALDVAGQIFCWGANANGQLGVGDAADRPSPTPVVSGDATLHGLAAGYRHTCAVDVEGRVSCWGWNDGGQLGDGSTHGAWQPLPPRSDGPPIEEVVGGGFHTCARTTSGALLCWGADESGQLGRGDWMPGASANPSQWAPALVDGFGC